MYYYELHEGDDDVFSDLLLAREEELPPDEFLDIVQSVRRRIRDTFEHDTLIEAVAEELERSYGFLPILDSRISASVHVGVDDEETYLTRLDDEAEGADYRGLLVDYDPDDQLQN